MSSDAPGGTAMVDAKFVVVVPRKNPTVTVAVVVVLIFPTYNVLIFHTWLLLAGFAASATEIVVTVITEVTPVIVVKFPKLGAVIINLQRSLSKQH